MKLQGDDVVYDKLRGMANALKGGFMLMITLKYCWSLSSLSLISIAYDCGLQMRTNTADPYNLHGLIRYGEGRLQFHLQ